jgi:hypothetical protein
MGGDCGGVEDGDCVKSIVIGLNAGDGGEGGHEESGSGRECGKRRVSGWDGWLVSW